MILPPPTPVDHQRQLAAFAEALSANTTGASEDSIACAEASYPVADGLNYPGQIAAQDRRKRRPNGQSRSDFGIHHIHRGGGNEDAHIAGLQLGKGASESARFSGPPFWFKMTARTSQSPLRCNCGRRERGRSKHFLSARPAKNRIGRDGRAGRQAPLGLAGAARVLQLESRLSRRSALCAPSSPSTATPVRCRCFAEHASHSVPRKPLALDRV